MRIIGIDLGTTNSCVAAVDETGAARVLPGEEGERLTPSIVAFTKSGEMLVGGPARRQAVTNAHRTIYGAKRLIGRKVNSDEVTWFARAAPFRIVAAPNGDAWIRVGDERVPPQEIAGHVLGEMRAIAERTYGEPVTRAVVTVPAYFDDVQRQAVRDAGQIAGLDIVRILNEPTAAALAYGAHRVSKDRRVLAVFDLGGGTFDVSVMAVENGVFEVLATNGDTALGGDDWDNRIIELIADEIFDDHRIDITGVPVALSRLKDAAERAKMDLSGADEAVVQLPFLATSDTGEEIHIERVLTRAEFEALTADLRERLAVPCRRVVKDAGIPLDRIDEVLLVGGMTRSPAIQSLVASLFGREPSKADNPEEVVGVGAAQYGGVLSGAHDDAALLDVTPHDIGIKVGDSSFAVLIPRNSMLPVRARRKFATISDDQQFVSIELYEGNSEDLADKRLLGAVRLDDLPPGKAGEVMIQLMTTIDVESLVEVTVAELSTGAKAQLRIKPTGGLSRKELVELIAKRRRRSTGQYFSEDGSTGPATTAPPTPAGDDGAD